MAEYKELEKNVDRNVCIYECGDCGHVFVSTDVPMYCPGCGEPLD